MTRRRWIADNWSPTTATLTGEQANHLARVLRAQTGQIFDVVAGGFLHRAEIVSVSPEAVEFALHEELEAEAALPLHLYLAVFKFDHFEWAIEKSTELGVGRITPILARRTEKHLAQAAVKRVERWRKIAHEAAQQSRRTDVPAIADPLALKLALTQESSPTRILLSETEQETTITYALDRAKSLRDPGQESETWVPTDDSIALAIGPEGGWTPEEMALFAEHKWQHVTLGPRILRAETAAIAAIAIAGTHFA
ncbi:16S rRNA (uracil1498-N3)-methyltransferase [Granulicella rosea]|uniref:Ribosomal RNA small subunit methyltransferase E n=1 Tax=Granulicella rosea TaxID=474952 RepID=A0A239IF51_9BACT|nr:RsmE family RNA methyltransferase [Granulicella rosea]SNS92175.1 16S rRNA (uracil1498-N3)-methyltransferase [Granulicella rosea]